jgi:hypothetical protein
MPPFSSHGYGAESASGLNILRRTTVFRRARAEYLRGSGIHLATKMRLRAD